MLKLVFIFSLLSHANAWSENLFHYSNAETKEYYKALLAKQKAGATLKLEDFNQTFNPIETAPAYSEESFARCKDKAIDGDCRPDTYYSWGEQPKLDTISKNSADSQKTWNEPLNSNISIYLNSSSIGSYCYGTLPVRFHYSADHYPELGPLNQKNWDRFSLLEWWINYYIHNAEAQAIIESVSFGQPEHFDEMITEIQRRMDPKEKWSETLLYSPAYEEPLKLKLLSGCLPERHPTTEATLVTNLTLFLDTVLNHKGWVHFQNCPNCAREEHFKTNWPTFFNPR